MITEEIEVQDHVSDYYSNLRYKNKHSVIYHESLVSIVISLIEKNGLILDNGCGIGDLSAYHISNNIVGMDISEGMLNKAKARMDLIVRGNTEKLPFRTGTFSTVICRSLLHHVKNKKHAISEMARVLQKDGELILVEPIKTVISKIPRKLMKGSDHFSSLHGDFKKEELIRLLGNSFNLEKCVHVGYIAYPLLGFPDIVFAQKYIPFKDQSVPILLKIDKFLSKLPIINQQSWGIILRLTKNEIDRNY
ncbi:MAG: class I SAM-dependent methyltransferase [Promethearchaeota archaeon]